jgi:hypothetical protein
VLLTRRRTGMGREAEYHLGRAGQMRVLIMGPVLLLVWLVEAGTCQSGQLGGPLLALVFAFAVVSMLVVMLVVEIEIAVEQTAELEVRDRGP